MPLATIACVFRRGDRLKRADVVGWAAFARGPRHADRRVTEHKATFVVDMVSDKVYDGHREPSEFDRARVVVLKQTGAFWQVSHGRLTPDIVAAPTGAAFRLAMTRVGLDTASIVLKSNGSEWRSWSGAPASIYSLADERAFHAFCATPHGPDCVTDWLTRPG